MNKFLPISKKDMDERGWTELDIILVTGDAYVDHPSYGVAVIMRVLENAGFKVGVIAQPDWKDTADFKKLGAPKLFFGVTAGNLDSMIANYTANKKLRHEDDFSPGGQHGLRPDRATIMYTNRIKEAFPGAPVVIGGIEASCRRLAHYDYWSEKVRRSILLDAKADMLVYGMGEKQILDIAMRARDGESIKNIDNIHGTVILKNNIDSIIDHVIIPSFEEVSKDKDKFNEAFKITYINADPFSGRTIIQKHANRFVVQLPPAMPLAEAEMDKVYGLDYARAWHPVYDREKGVPGFETVKNSIISHRGCPAECSFCSIYLHQGRIIQSRSRKSIVEEIKRLVSQPYFKGTVTDIGGPTANMYKAHCERWKSKGACTNKKCVIPRRCESLRLGYDETMNLWSEAGGIPNVNHIFIGSGVRYDLLTDASSDRYLKELCARHISGQLKVAPEHTEGPVLALMNKTGFDSYKVFLERFRDVNSRLGKKQYLVNYFIIAHPGSRLEDTLNMSLELMKLGIYPEQVQDFIPLPMTASGAMYYTGKDPFTGKTVYAAQGLRERRMHRALIQYKEESNRKYILEALKKMGRMDLAKTFFAKHGGVWYGDKSRKTEW